MTMCPSSQQSPSSLSSSNLTGATNHPSSSSSPPSVVDKGTVNDLRNAVVSNLSNFAISINNTGVDLLRCKKNTDALQLFDCVYSRLRVEISNHCQLQITSLLLQLQQQVQQQRQQVKQIMQPMQQQQQQCEHILYLNNLNQTLLSQQEQQHQASTITTTTTDYCIFSKMRNYNNAIMTMSTTPVTTFNNTMPPQQFSNNNKNESSTASTTETNNISEPHDPIVRIRSVKIDDSNTVCMPNDADLFASPSNFFSIYNRAFVFADKNNTEDDEEDEDDDNNSFISSSSSSSSSCGGDSMKSSSPSVSIPESFYYNIPAVVLYNAGLTFHRMAVFDGSEAKYRKALELYQLSRLLIHINTGMNDLNNQYLEDLDIICLALANNMGHIHSHLFHSEATRLCLEQMMEIFSVTDCKCFLSQDEYAFFYMNILLALGRYPILSPAA